MAMLIYGAVSQVALAILQFLLGQISRMSFRVKTWSA